MKRDPRANPPKPEIRNPPPPDDLPDDEDEEDGPTATSEPWAELEGVLSPFHDARSDRILERVQQVYEDEDADLETLTTAAYEGLADAANEELRQIVTRLRHALQLGLMQTGEDEGPITRDTAGDMLEALEHAGELLDAHLTREEIAKRFLDLSEDPFQISKAVRESLEDRDLLEEVEMDLDPAPIRGDRERLSGAIAELVEYLARASGEGTVLLEMSWEDDELEAFVGTRPPRIPLEELLDQMSRPPILQEADLDLPLARAILEFHGGTLVIDAPDPDTAGFRFTLPALSEPSLSG